MSATRVIPGTGFEQQASDQFTFWRAETGTRAVHYHYPIGNLYELVEIA
jgi:hypothetical protein